MPQEPDIEAAVKGLTQARREALVSEGSSNFDVDATAPECGIDWRLHGRNGEVVMGTAATPALALAAACLRAKGLQAESHSGTCTA